MLAIILDIHHKSDQTMLFPRAEGILPYKCASGLSLQFYNPWAKSFCGFGFRISYYEKEALEWSQKECIKYVSRFLNSQSKRLIDQRKKQRKKERALASFLTPRPKLFRGVRDQRGSGAIEGIYVLD